MAKRISHRKADESRVYKAGDVHKRRVDRSARSKAALGSIPSVTADDEPKREGGRTQFVNVPEVVKPQEDASQQDPTASQPPVGESATGSTPPVDQQPAASGAQPEGKPAEAATAQGKPAAQASTKPSVKPSIEKKRVGQGDAGATAPGKPTLRRVKVDEGAAGASQRSKLRLAIVVGFFVVLVVAVVGSLLYWNRCFRYDDHADMKGTWYVAGTVVPITIDEGSIRFTDDVSYDYTVDTAAKTIDVALGNMTGKSHYRFSNDRKNLVIASDDSAAASFVDSQGLARVVDDFASLFGIGGFVAPTGDGVVALSREPSPLAVVCNKMVEAIAPVKAEIEERKKQEEEEAERESEEAEYEAALAGGYYYY